MAKYNVMIEAMARMYVEVEAGSEEQAMDIVHNDKVNYNLDNLEIDRKSADVVEAELMEE